MQRKKKEPVLEVVHGHNVNISLNKNDNINLSNFAEHSFVDVNDDSLIFQKNNLPNKLYTHGSLSDLVLSCTKKKEIQHERDNASHKNLLNKLRLWVIKYNVSHNCWNAILGIIKSEGLKIP